MADTLPNLSHRRPPTTDRSFWQCECGTLVFGDDSPAGFICDAAVAAWGAEQRDAAAAKERAAVVAWLRLGASWGVLDDYTPDQVADAIEAGDHLEATRAFQPVAAALVCALDATTGRTWHTDDDGAHTTGWIWRVERIGTRLHLTAGTVLIAEVEPDPDPWVTAEAIADAIAAHTARITTTTEEPTP